MPPFVWSPQSTRRPPAATLQPRVPFSSRVAMFQAGHGWLQGSGVGTNSDDTTDFALGAQSRKYVSAGDNGFVRDTKSGLTIDLTGKYVRVLMKFDKVLATQLKGGQLYLGTDSSFANNYKAEIFDFLAGPTRNPYWLPNEWQWVTLGLSEFAVTGSPTLSTITAVRIALQDQTGNVVTSHANAVDLMPQPANAVVSINFDDGWLSNWAKVKGIMDPYGFPATLYQIAERAINADAGTDTVAMTTAQIKELQRSSGWEIASHAYTKAMHDANYTSYSDDAVRADFRKMKDWATDNGFRGADHFAWPIGVFDNAKLAVAREFFVSARTIQAQAMETYPPADRMRLRWVSTAQASGATLTAAVDKAIAQKGWAIFGFHDIADVIGGTGVTWGSIQTLTSAFQTFVDYVATKVAAGTVKVKTTGDVLTSGPS